MEQWRQAGIIHLCNYLRNLARVRNPNEAGVHNENDFNMLTRVLRRHG
jgi:hypothetical protein